MSEKTSSLHHSSNDLPWFAPDPAFATCHTQSSSSQNSWQTFAPPPQPSCPNKVAFNKPVKTLWKTEELNAERTIMQVRAADGPGIHNQRLLPWDNHVLHASNSLHPRQTATPPKERRDPFAMPLQN